MKNDQRNNRSKSKSSPPHGKKGDINIDWSKYLEHRRAEGANRKELMSCIADKACELLGLEKGP